MLSPQLPLAMQLRDTAGLENFYPDGNQWALDEIQAWCQGQHSFVYLCGAPGTGKSHLLQGAYLACQTQGAMYVSLAEPGLTPQHLLELAECPFLCVDDVAAITHDLAWQQALFDLFNRCREHQHHLLIAAPDLPQHLPISLADLRSRWQWGLTLTLKRMSDRDKIRTLQLRAKSRGLWLAPQVAQYLLHHVSADMHALMALLQQLDQASLQAQRRLTLPFVRQVLNN